MGPRGGAIAIAVVLGLGILLSVIYTERAPDLLALGSTAPGFDLPRSDGESSLALDDLSGQVVLVNFWATWCKPCEDEMPAMERLYHRLQGEDFELVAVSVDESAEDVEDFRDRLGLSFPILLDPQRRAAHAYQAYRYPESFLIDRTGRLASKYIGPRDWDTPSYEDGIRRLLGRPPGRTDG